MHIVGSIGRWYCPIPSQEQRKPILIGRQRCRKVVPQMMSALTARASHVERSIVGGLLGSPAALARDDVGGVPPRPVVLRSGRFVLAMALLCLSQKLGQRRDVHAAEPASGKPRLDLLEHPAVAVGIVERGKREIGATFRIRPRHASLRPGEMEAALEMEHLTHVDPVADELGACCVDVVDHEQQSLNGARRCRRESLAEEEGARRAGRCHLHHPPAVTVGEIGVQPPSHAQVEALGAIDVGHRNDDDLELHVDLPGARDPGCAFIAHLCAAHGDLRAWW